MNSEYKIGDVVLHNWKLTELLGEGSYGKVYKAVRRDIAGEYVAAIKIITIPRNEEEKRAAFAEGMTESSVSDYFRSVVDDMSREFTLMSKLKGDSNIVSYEDHDIIPHPDGIGWDIIIRMELLIPFSSIIERGELPPKEIIKLGIDLCRALELCRKYSIIHRDIKPANIFKSETGQYKLGDFGVARTIERTTGGVTKAGTYNYMAPEVYREEPYGATVDIYSLGLVLYQLLNKNRLPFLPPYPDQIRKSDRDSALAKRMSGEKIPYPANDYGRLTDIVLKACEYDPRKRYRTPEEMRRELEGLIGTTRLEKQKKKTTKRKSPKASVLICTFMLLLLTVGTAAFLWGRTRFQNYNSELSNAESQSIISTGQDASNIQDQIIIDSPAGTTEPFAATKDEKVSEPIQDEPETKPEETNIPQDADGPQTSSSVLITEETKVVSLKECSVGDYVLFGNYEQNNDLTDGKEAIEWLVLDRQDEKALLISKYALECQCYASNGSDGGVRWENCTLRTWLNDTFVSEAFSLKEYERIQSVVVSMYSNPEYGTYSGNNTWDKVFLLSADEAKKYFSNSDERVCTATKWALAHGAYKSEDTERCYWWLRTTGSSSYFTAVVNTKGDINYYGVYALDDYGSARPAIWVSVN